MKRRKLTYDDGFWVYFGYGEGWDPDRCKKCYTLLEKFKKPNEYCIDCWKLEIFFSNCTDVDKAKEYFLESAKEDYTLHGKWIKKEMEIPRSILTSIPAEAHPDPEVKRDGVILIYTQSIKERDARKNKILADLKALGLYRKNAISSRRGCVNFDEIIGNWKTWYPVDKDYAHEVDQQNSDRMHGKVASD